MARQRLRAVVLVATFVVILGQGPAWGDDRVAGTDLSDCSGGVVFDDGTAEWWISPGDPDNPVSESLVIGFTPPEYPYRIMRLCFAWVDRSSGGTTFPFSAVLYDDWGDVSPTASVPDVVTAPPWGGPGSAVSFFSTDVSGAFPVIQQGSVEVGAKWIGITGGALGADGASPHGGAHVDSNGNWIALPAFIGTPMIRIDGGPIPVASFSWAPSEPEPGEQVQFSDASTGSPESWQWDFGDGATSTRRNPSHSFASSGTYQVTLRVSNPQGTDVHSAQVQVVAAPPPQASFTYQPTHPEPGQVVAFADTSTGAPTSWHWAFGDGGESSSQNPIHTFASIGHFDVTLTVSNQVGSDSVTDNLTVGQAPTADFSWDPAQPTVAQPIRFTDRSANATSWSWQFGDGGVSSDADPVHTYAAPGEYSVRLTASNPLGSDSRSRIVTVAARLTADFGWTPEMPAYGESVRFEDRSAGSPSSWAWDFGDGQTSHQQHPTHGFLWPGEYRVQLEVSDGTETSSVAHTVVVGSEPFASFEWSPHDPRVGEQVSFVDTSSSSPTEWSWEFGDGGSSTDRNPSHAYEDSGTFTVSLTATNDYGADTVSRQIRVGMPPEAAFAWDPLEPEPGEEVHFEDASTGSPHRWQWFFGDGETSEEQHPVHVFASSGQYDVILVASNASGSDTTMHTIAVQEPTPEDHVLFLPGVAHTPGFNNTIWRSDLAACNFCDSELQYDLEFIERESSPTIRSLHLPVEAGSCVRLNDVVSIIAGTDGAVGALRITSQCDRTIVSARTYNDALTGTYGSFAVALPASEGIQEGEPARLIHLSESADLTHGFRTNLSLMNVTGADVTAEVGLHRHDGTLLDTVTIPLSAYQYRQFSRVFLALGEVGDGYLTVSTLTPGGSVIASASVVDNLTGDGVNVPAVERAEPTASYLMGAGHIGGLNDTEWRTSAEICNTGEVSSLTTLSLLLRDQPNPSPEQMIFAVEPQHCRRLDDVVGLFGIEGVASLMVEGEGLCCAARTYNQTPVGTYGSFTLGRGHGDSVSTGEWGVITQLEHSTDSGWGFRTNLGLLNLSTFPVTVVVEVFDGGGAQLGELSVDLRAREYRQLLRLYQHVTGDDVADGFVIVRSPTTGGEFLAAASVVDNRSGDGVSIPVVVMREVQR